MSIIMDSEILDRAHTYTATQAHKARVRTLRTFSAALCLIAYLKPCSAQPMAAKELIENAARFDNETVVYEGEVVGEVLERQGGAWVNVHDGTLGIGIWVPASIVREIAYTGSYVARGDWVEATGVFYRACPVHGGDLDIHATALEKKRAGRSIVEPLHRAKRNYVLILTGVLCLVLILTRSGRT